MYNLFERFINVKIFQGLKRPQRLNECSVTSLASAINALYKTDISADDVLMAANFDRKYVTDGNVGNEDIAKLFLEMYPRGSAEVIRSIGNFEKDWNYLKRLILDTGNALILHINCHYNLIAGYFEEPSSYKYLNSKEFSTTNNWLIIADQSTKNDALWLLEYTRLLTKIKFNKHYGIIKLSIFT
jgi:hypothetical protein